MRIIKAQLNTISVILFTGILVQAAVEIKTQFTGSVKTKIATETHFRHSLNCYVEKKGTETTAFPDQILSLIGGAQALSSTGQVTWVSDLYSPFSRRIRTLALTASVDETPIQTKIGLQLNDAYLSARAIGARYISMNYPFPIVKLMCPLCGSVDCARWKGYFVRDFFCTFLDYVGPIAIHVGHCRSKGSDFSYFPSFLLPGRSPSRLTLGRFAESAKASRNTSESIGVLSEGISEPNFSVSSSTAYSWISSICLSLCINELVLGLSSHTTKSVYSIYGLPLKILTELFTKRGCRWNVHQSIVFYPP